MPLKLLLVDDHSLFVAGMRHVLGQLDADLQLLETNDGAGAMRLAAEHPDLDLVLLDLQLAGHSGLDVLRAMSRDLPAVPVVVVSASEDPDDVRRALDGGALGYVPKSSTAPVMLSALRLVLAGGVYFPPDLVDAAAPQPPAPAGPDQTPTAESIGLTSRQLEVLSYVVAGCSNKEIARRFDLSVGTVKAHVSAILRTLGAKNRTEAARRVNELNIQLPPGP